MAAPTLIYRRGGAPIIPFFISALKRLHWENALRLNQQFIPFKAVFFLLWAGLVSLLPFLPVYMSYLGLNAVQVGAVRGIEPFIGMFSSLLCGSLADKFSMHRFIMVSSIIATGFVYGSGVFVSFIDTNHVMNWTNISHVPLEGYIGELEKIKEEQLEMDTSLIQIWKSYNCGCCHHCMSSNCKTEEFRKSDIDLTSDNEFSCSFACCLCSCRLENETFQELINECVRDYNRPKDECHEICSNASTLSKMTNRTSISNLSQYQRRERTDTQSPKFGAPKEKDLTLAFILMLMIVITGQFVSNPFTPFLDAAAMALVKECNDKGQNVEYGHQRLWGGIAWGVMAPLSGLAVDRYSAAYPESFNKYLPAFIFFFVFVLMSVVPALFISFLRHSPPESLASNLGTLIRRPKVLVFLYAIFITGVSVGVIKTFLFLFLAELSGSHTIMGLTLTLTSMAEVPFMFFATKLIERLGHRGVFVLTLFCFTLRFVGYSFLQNPWLVLPIELLHGVTYGALWPACTSYVNLITPDNMLTTMQSITYSIRLGLGNGIGALLGGVIYHQYGARNLFRGSAVLCMLTLIFYWPVSAYLDRRDERTRREYAETNEER
ncbi:major facilitator superfamily domain-containing protein 6-like isoform X1 [Lytechinus pictus]|uniref:major facilitator superfamily domain-containing protein 6-like isoform X1 n=3 Tax=Lytechinus pictus TaxID=7653 RepID=UPI0030B9C10D